MVVIQGYLLLIFQYVLSDDCPQKNSSLLWSIVTVAMVEMTSSIPTTVYPETNMQPAHPIRRRRKKIHTFKCHRSYSCSCPAADFQMLIIRLGARPLAQQLMRLCPPHAGDLPPTLPGSPPIFQPEREHRRGDTGRLKRREPRDVSPLASPRRRPV